MAVVLQRWSCLHFIFTSNLRGRVSILWVSRFTSLFLTLIHSCDASCGTSRNPLQLLQEVGGGSSNE